MNVHDVSSTTSNELTQHEHASMSVSTEQSYAHCQYIIQVVSYTNKVAFNITVCACATELLLYIS